PDALPICPHRAPRLPRGLRVGPALARRRHQLGGGPGVAARRLPRAQGARRCARLWLPMESEALAPSAPPDTQRFECRSCGAVLHIPRLERTAICPYCDAPTVVERHGPAAARPAFALGFVLDQRAAHARARAFVRAKHFARSDFRRAPFDKTRPVYFPAYLYGAVARSRYTARIGEHYQEIEHYTTVDSKGNTVRRTRVVTRTEWRSLQGLHETYVRDVLVSASGTLSNQALEAIEPFDLRALKRYDPALLAGLNAEEPSLSRDACLVEARRESGAGLDAALARFMPGDHHAGLERATELLSEQLDLSLVPIWVLAVRYRED